VFAVPGHPLDPRAAGPNGLIKSGAHLVTGANDILIELFANARGGAHWREAAGPADWRVLAQSRGETIPASQHGRDAIIELLSYAPVHTGILLRQSGLSARELAVALLELDLAGRIQRHEDERVSLKPAPCGAA
jgi:DNA processing protein